MYRKRGEEAGAIMRGVGGLGVSDWGVLMHKKGRSAVSGGASFDLIARLLKQRCLSLLDLVAIGNDGFDDPLQVGVVGFEVLGVPDNFFALVNVRIELLFASFVDG